jgi:hypothetical protein
MRVSRHALSPWWTDDLRPLSGPVRAGFYYGLLLVAVIAAFVAPPPSWWDLLSPLAVPDHFRNAEISYWPRGLIAWLPVPTAGQLHVLRAVTILAWLCAGAGLFFRLSSILTAVGFATLSAINFSYGSGHGWTLPVWALFALCFSSTDDRWTADSHLARRWPRYPFRPPPPEALSRTGFARKLVVIFIAWILFAAGISKLLTAGPRWMDGCSLQSYMAVFEPMARWRGLSRFLQHHPGLIKALAAATIVFEVGAIVAPFSRRLRHVVIAAAIGFHIGILLVMHPLYFPNMVTFALAIDWPSRSPAGSDERPRLSRRDVAVPAIVLCLVFAVVGTMRLEWFPITHVPMYSVYSCGDVVSDRDGDLRRIQVLANLETVQRLAKQRCTQRVWWSLEERCVTGGLAFPVSNWVSARTALRFAGGEGCDLRVSHEDLSKSFGSIPPHWGHVLGGIALRELAERPQLPGGRRDVRWRGQQVSPENHGPT